MTTTDVANRLVELCRQGQNLQAVEELYAPNILSLEPNGTPQPKTVGFDQVKEKSIQFDKDVQEFHGSEIGDPQIAGDFFSLTMSMDCTFKSMGRVHMEEVCVYQVQDEKIVQEQFFYNAESEQSA